MSATLKYKKMVYILYTNNISVTVNTNTSGLDTTILSNGYYVYIYMRRQQLNDCVDVSPNLVRCLNTVFKQILQEVH